MNNMSVHSLKNQISKLYADYRSTMKALEGQSKRNESSSSQKSLQYLRKHANSVLLKIRNLQSQLSQVERKLARKSKRSAQNISFRDMIYA
ncbi:hypothetical protein MK079_04945 [Candidatus Gracilibacteria bacterium]|nr:hypothetical protein [Candidatus Gracilibacteria bacterium]